MVGSIQQRGMVEFFKCFNNNPEALIRLLSMYVAGEERSEISPLLSLSRGLPDCPLRTMVRRQLADEGRHAGLYRKRIAELGGRLYPIPDDLELQEYHFQKKGDPLKQALQLTPEEASKPERIAEILLFVSVIEEFLLPRLMAHAEACRAADPRTYFLLMDIFADELRHVVYTQEQVYMVAGPERLESVKSLHQRLRATQAMHGGRMFRAMIDRLFPRDVLKVSRAKYLAIQAVARHQERVGAAVPDLVPVACPEALVRLAAPFGIGGRAHSGDVAPSLIPSVA